MPNDFPKKHIEFNPSYFQILNAQTYNFNIEELVNPVDFLQWGVLSIPYQRIYEKSKFENTILFSYLSLCVFNL